jgi:hypothetical protein
VLLKEVIENKKFSMDCLLITILQVRIAIISAVISLSCSQLAIQDPRSNRQSALPMNQDGPSSVNGSPNYKDKPLLNGHNEPTSASGKEKIGQNEGDLEGSATIFRPATYGGNDYQTRNNGNNRQYGGKCQTAYFPTQRFILC